MIENQSDIVVNYYCFSPNKRKE